MPGRRRSHPLNRAELVEGALAIVDAEGLPALTMRRLADALGVEAMSLYHHVPSKDVLLDWTVDRMRSEMRLDSLESVSGDWRDVLATVFGELRRVMAAHPNMLPLATRRTGSAEISGLEYLIECGFDRESAVELYQSLAAFTVGYAALSSPAVESEWRGLPQELAERSRDWRDETFGRTLRAIMEGYESRRGEAR
jgi:TetR/AcrR family tetracycline transcriptional repressor